MMFLDWQFTAQDDEYLEPARYQYREAFILVDAMYRDEPVMWCPYIYVDNDAALARGWTQGFPKKMGSIFQTRSFAALGPAAAPVASGGRFGRQLWGRQLSARQLGSRLGAPLTKLCFEGPADALNRTDVSQPAIYTTSTRRDPSNPCGRAFIITIRMAPIRIWRVIDGSVTSLASHTHAARYRVGTIRMSRQRPFSCTSAISMQIRTT